MGVNIPCRRSAETVSRSQRERANLVRGTLSYSSLLSTSSSSPTTGGAGSACKPRKSSSTNSTDIARGATTRTCAMLNQMMVGKQKGKGKRRRQGMTFKMSRLYMRQGVDRPPHLIPADGELEYYKLRTWGGELRLKESLDRHSRLADRVNDGKATGSGLENVYQSAGCRWTTASGEMSVNEWAYNKDGSRSTPASAVYPIVKDGSDTRKSLRNGFRA